MSQTNSTRPWDRRSAETVKAYAAFRFYCELGARRSVREAARQNNIKTTSLSEKNTRVNTTVRPLAARAIESHAERSGEKETDENRCLIVAGSLPPSPRTRGDVSMIPLRIAASGLSGLNCADPTARLEQMTRKQKPQPHFVAEGRSIIRVL